MMECVAGCNVFTGGEIRHHPDCPYYPESLSLLYDMTKEENVSLKLQLDYMQKTLDKVDFSLDLLCCPFCGGKPVKGMFNIWCDTCKASTDGDDTPGEKEVIRRWNRRAT